MSQAAQTFTLQLSSAAAATMGSGHYKQILQPGIKVPYLARPWAALESMAFSNSFCNVDVALYNNNKVVLSYTPDPAEPAVTVTLSVPDGNYSIESLELELARQAYATAQTGYIDPNPGSTMLWDFMQATTAAHSDGVTHLVQSGTLGSADVVIVETNLSAANKGMTVTSSVVGAIPAGTTVQSVNLATKTFTLSAALAKNLTGAGAAANPTITLVQNAIGQYGFGVRESGLALPVLTTDSNWGQALTFAEMQSIAACRWNSTASEDAVPPIYVEQAVAGTPYKAVPKSQRYIRPFYLNHEASNNKLQFITLPQVTVAANSTLFSSLLGFSIIAGPAQNPWLNNGKIWEADEAARLDMVRSLELHVPSLVSNSYNQDGRMQGAQLASVPVTVPQNYTQVWSAAYDNSVPLDLHGADIDSIEFYLTNQDGKRVNLQGNQFQISLRIGWPDPAEPPLGSAGAENRLADVRALYR